MFIDDLVWFSGCKFSLEEERIVIELQAQFGNKWARIATYLPGRTDNDVKNFWSSRQKRLARILQNSATPSSSSNTKSHKTNREVSTFHDAPTLQVNYLHPFICGSFQVTFMDFNLHICKQFHRFNFIEMLVASIEMSVFFF